MYDDDGLPSENYNEFHRILNEIQRCDPQGGDREPTEKDMTEHEAWARAQYGNDAWEAYRRGGWADPWF